MVLFPDMGKIGAGIRIVDSQICTYIYICMCVCVCAGVRIKDSVLNLRTSLGGVCV